MSGKYYNIGVGTPIANIAAALLDYFKLYDVGTNPTGYNELFISAEYLVFTCTAITDKVIRVRWVSSAIQHEFADSHTSGSTVVGAIHFGGTDVNTAMTSIELVLSANGYFLTTGPHGSTTGARSPNRNVIIGKLSSGQYGVCGTRSATTNYVTGHASYITTTKDRAVPSGIFGHAISPDGKLYKQNIILLNTAGAAIADPVTGGEIWFLDAFALSFYVRATPFKASNFLASGAYVAEATGITSWSSYVSEFTTE